MEPRRVIRGLDLGLEEANAKISRAPVSPGHLERPGRLPEGTEEQAQVFEDQKDYLIQVWDKKDKERL